MDGPAWSQTTELQRLIHIQLSRVTSSVRVYDVRIRTRAAAERIPSLAALYALR